MAILRMPLDPSVGTPQPVILQPRRRMTDPRFYSQQQVQQQPTTPVPSLNEQPRMPLSSTGETQQQSTSQQFIEQHLKRLAERPPVPELDPGTRVIGPNMELVQPSNFETFYHRLTSIRDINNELLSASQARSAYKRMQELQAAQAAAYSGGSGGRSGGGSPYQERGSGVGSVPSNPKANFKYAESIAGNFGWASPGELAAWYTLGMKESGWNNNAQNPTSTAYGIGQFLNSTWAGVGIGKTSDPALQVEAMARYIRNRYGSPSKALAFHRAHNWY